MKIIALLLVMCAFISCNNECIEVNDIWGNFGYEFAETEFSAFEVLSPEKDYWTGPYTSTYFYTDPDGKGECYHSDETPATSTSTDYRFSFAPDKIIFYQSNFTYGPISPYYTEYPLIESNENTFIFERFFPDGTPANFYIRVLDYDDNNILIETNKNWLIANDIEYKYSIILLERGNPTDSNWKDRYVSYEEYLKALEELENK